MDDDGGTGSVLTIRVVSKTGSTNADLLIAGAAGAPEGEWLRAERQVAGRGRLGRPWEDGTGNLFASTIVRLRPADPPAPSLTLVAAVALADTVAAYAPGIAMLKWPNDLMIGTAKLSGILLERGGGDLVVIGFGVNLACHPDLSDRRTTCLAEHGVTVSPAAFLDALAQRLATRLSKWRTIGLANIREAWLAAAHPVGTRLRVTLPDGRIVAGLFDGLDASGALRLQADDGEQVLVYAGDVAA
jgi:BirA family biotin operon repressor/biotin-[acetyl-CoA-carboxylase] ligase